MCRREGCLKFWSSSGSFFFFQAEDGIRDLIVTGVQTCALPIYASAVGRRFRRMASHLGRRLAVGPHEGAREGGAVGEAAAGRGGGNRQGGIPGVGDRKSVV